MKRIIILICMICISLPAFSADWTAKGIMHDPETDQDSWKGFRDADNHFFLVEDGLNVTDEEAASIIKMKDIFFSWQNVKFRDIKFSIEGSVINAVVIPSDLKNDSLDLVPYLPAGMLFYTQNESMQYNFRIKKDTYFLKITGAFISDKVLFDKITEAVRTPQTFVQRRDPDYLLSQLDRINYEQDQLKKSIIALNNKGFFSNRGPVDSKAVDKVVELRTKNPSIKISEIEAELAKEKIQILTSEIELILNVYFNQFAK
ncbi:MAG TPA: hypothetical protein PKK43_01165 [Spirochaetota bacterium]|nr:hypothetical protein [Spirochaetota bacterium]